MKQQSDTVQHVAQAYAEREVLQACVRTLRGGGLSPSLRALLEPAIRLYAVHRLEQVRMGAGQGLQAACPQLAQAAAVPSLCLTSLLSPSSSSSSLHPPHLQDLSWFLLDGLVPLAAGRAVGEAARGLCAALAPQTRVLVDSFAIPEHLVAAPIAADWAAYNAGDNRGELLAGVWGRNY